MSTNASHAITQPVRVAIQRRLLEPASHVLNAMTVTGLTEKFGGWGRLAPDSRCARTYRNASTHRAVASCWMSRRPSSGTRDTPPPAATISRLRDVSSGCLVPFTQRCDARSDPQRSRTAHRILHESEVDDITRLEVVDGRAGLQVGTMEKHLSAVA
jgi:hypothetical protein